MSKKEIAAASIVPSVEVVAKAVKDVEAIAGALAGTLVSLTKKQRRHMPKIRKGGDDVVELVYSLATKHGAAVPGLKAEVMKHNLDLAAVLAPLAIAAGRLEKSILDTILNARGKAWAAGTTYYTALGRAAKSNGDLQDSLKPATRFFKRRKAKPKAPKDAPSGSTRSRSASPDGNGSTSRVSR